VRIPEKEIFSKQFCIEFMGNFWDLEHL